MNYTLHQLKVFLKVAQTQSITRAAEELHLTQPAVSIQLKNLQEQFEIPLTEVIGRKLYVTDFGREIAIASERVLAEVESINYKMLAYKGEVFGKLRFSIASTGKYIMPYFLSDFLDLHKGVELVMDVTNKASVLESLDKNEVDFALVSILPENLKTDKVVLMQNRLFLVGGKNQPQGEQNGKEILENSPLIFRENGSATRQTMEAFISNQNIKVNKTIELTSNEAVKQAVVAGLGYSIMPLIGIKNELKNGDLRIIPMKGLPIQTDWHLIWLKNKKFSPAATGYLNYINEQKDTIIKEKFEWYDNYKG